MPVGAFKNSLYGAALALAGKRSQCREVVCNPGAAPSSKPAASAQLGSLTAPCCAPLVRIFRHRHVVGATVQRLSQGRLAECYAAGLARLGPSCLPATADTFYRTASIAKLATALLVFRLQTLGKLDVREDIAAFLRYAVRNPLHKDLPITLGMLLSHTSSIVDSPAYFQALTSKQPLSRLLSDPAAFSPAPPGSSFRYSNLAAGMIGCLLEARFGKAFPLLAQEYLFGPLGLCASFDLSACKGLPLADSYRVLPAAREPSFDGTLRMQSAQPLAQAQPELRYPLASGSLFLTAPGLGRLALLAWDGQAEGEAFLSRESLCQLKEPLGQWPDHDVPLRHGMGLLTLQDKRVSSRLVYGHQGFAYGAVNGVFWTEDGDGFALLNSGASEQRKGHLALLNQDLIGLFAG